MNLLYLLSIGLLGGSLLSYEFYVRVPYPYMVCTKWTLIERMNRFMSRKLRDIVLEIGQNGIQR